MGSGVDAVAVAGRVVLSKVEDGVIEESGLVFEAGAVVMAGIIAIAEDDEGAICSLFLGSSQQVPLVSMLQQNLPFWPTDPSHWVMKPPVANVQNSGQIDDEYVGSVQAPL